MDSKDIYVTLTNKDFVDVNNRCLSQNALNNHIQGIDERIDEALSGDDSEVCALVNVRKFINLSLIKFN